jgi:anti-sigma regulatory factor (Ser/Thr protein kinase)
VTRIAVTSRLEVTMDEPVVDAGVEWPDHCAVVYDSAAVFASSVRSFVGDGGGAPVLIVAPEPSLALVRDYSGDTGAQLRLADITAIGANPARIIPAIRAFADSCHGRAVRCVIEALWDGRSAEQRRETVRHEALLNQAFLELPVAILCAYDAAIAGAAAAELTHPELIRNGVRSASTGYDAGRVFPEGYDEPLDPVPGGAAPLGYGQNLRAVRAFASERARSAGMAVERIRDLIIAVGELVANTYRHTGGGGVLSVWVAGEELICQVHDSGHIDDPLAGRRPPAHGHSGGLGLWVVHQLCDLVEIRTGPGDTCIRLHMRLDGNAA